MSTLAPWILRSFREQLPGGGPDRIAAEMLRGMTLSYDNVSWAFSDDTVEIRNNGEEIPSEFAKEILGREVAPKTITASWALADEQPATQID